MPDRPAGDGDLKRLGRRSSWALLLFGALACGGGPTAPSIGAGTTSGTLAVTINGLPSGTDAAVSVSGPNGYSQSLTATGNLSGLPPGTYTISAQDVVATGGTTYTPAPVSQDASVQAGLTARVSVTYSPPSSGDLNLRIDGMYLTQSTQTYAGAVPLVQNRDGYLRIFVVANRTNIVRPSVRVRLYKSLVLQSEMLIAAPGLSVPTAVDESSLSYSWNVPVAGSLIQPGLSIIAEVDTDNIVAESDESDNAFPSGAPLSLNVRAAPTLGITFVPVVQSGNRLKGSVSDATTDDFFNSTERMHPVAGYNARIHAAYTTTTPDTLEDDNGNGAWVTILREVDLLRVAENSSDYYYGVAKVSYTSGVAGVAYVSDPSTGSQGKAALGWDYLPSGSEVMAHELGHNWGRNHSPCGDAGGLDPGYPYSDGSIGVFGLDVKAQLLKSPSLSDIMAYCDAKWISDYTYSAVLDHLSPPSLLVTSAASQESQPTLLVWGYIRDGHPVLEPAFQVNTRPSLPRRAGAYALDARASDGSRIFALSFSPDQIADLPGHQESFVFAVPISDLAASRIASLRLAGPGRQAVVHATSTVSSSPQIERVEGGRVRLRWDSQAYPMIMVRDAATGEVLSLARGGQVEISSATKQFELILSDGVKSRRHRLDLR